MFRRRKAVDNKGFADTGIRAAALRAGEMVRVSVHGQRLILTLLDGVPVAFSETCPHGAASLAGGSLRGALVCCPDHGYCFDMRNGRIDWPPDEPYRLPCYAVKVENGSVKIRPEPE